MRTAEGIDLVPRRTRDGYAWHSAPHIYRTRPRPHSATSRRAHWSDRITGFAAGVIGVTASEVFFDGTITTVIRWIGGLL